MKAIQITFDKGLLAELDADEDVRREGRSAVLRRLAARFLEHKKALRIRQQYHEAYGNGLIDPDLKGWEDTVARSE